MFVAYLNYRILVKFFYFLIILSTGGTILDKKGVSRTLKGSSAQRSAGTFKGSRYNPLELVPGGTFFE